MVGRKPKPTHLKLIEGNPGKRRRPKHEPKTAGLPKPPSFLSDEAKQEWTRVCKVLGALGALTDMDQTALAAYCQVFGRWHQAETALREMAASGGLSRALLIKTAQGNWIQNPMLGVANRAMTEMNKIAVEFGFTPSSRARIGLALEPAANDDDIGRRFFG